MLNLTSQVFLAHYKIIFQELLKKYVQNSKQRNHKSTEGTLENNKILKFGDNLFSSLNQSELKKSVQSRPKHIFKSDFQASNRFLYWKNSKVSMSITANFKNAASSLENGIKMKNVESWRES